MRTYYVVYVPRDDLSSPLLLLGKWWPVDISFSNKSLCNTPAASLEIKREQEETACETMFQTTAWEW